jgi:flagellar export protein FliJ
MSLDALRKLHAQTVDALKMELAAITQYLMEREAAVQTLDADIHGAVAVYQQQTENGLSIESVWEWHRRMDSQETALSQARRDLVTLTASWHNTQARLVAANQERTILDRFLERRKLAERIVLGRREQMALDEAGHRQQALHKRPL